MARVLVTGMSGVGKSSALAELGRRGYRVVDTDLPGWSDEVPSDDGTRTEQLWREDRMAALLAEAATSHVFVSGCVANQGRFYDRFEAVVLLAAPLDVMLARIDARDGNPYGKSDAERRQVVEDLASVEPLLRRGATDEIDATRPPGEVVDELVAIADRDRGR